MTATHLISLLLASVDGPPTFEREIQPILTRCGCNAGACHGKARGQDGFALSLLAFDAEFDYRAVVKEGFGRRLSTNDPDNSLLLLKATGEVPHGGGSRLHRGSPKYETLRRWIESGAPRTPANSPPLEKVTLSQTRIVAAFAEKTPLRVSAHFMDGTVRDVTDLATYQSNDSGYVAVDENGVVHAGTVVGEAAVTARYQNHFAVCHVLIPYPDSPDPKLYDEFPRNNFIDGHVWEKLQALGFEPSAAAGDSVFHRRAYLDVIGRLPTAKETREFLADENPQKRESLIDRLLARPEYADFWAGKWADLLRPNPYHVGMKATLNFDAWLREQFRRNRPFDAFVRELLTASGSTFRDGATVFYRNRRDPVEIAPMVSQLFLGVRLDCAKCHQHPSERWSQRDFYRFAAFFAGVGRKGTGISAPISGGEEVIFPGSASPLKHPLTGETLHPTPLLGTPIVAPDDVDPRQTLADWITAPDNPYFARAIVNRVWADLMGRGLVEPVDDLRETNPPTNPKLLDALADSFRSDGYDLKKLIRHITTSHAYGLSSVPAGRNARDNRNYSRHYRKQPRAEVLLDAVCDVTGVAERFDAVPPGSRAVEAWTVRLDSKFLDSFGRPDPNQDPPCERITDTTLVQALHLMNAPGLNGKITAKGGQADVLASGQKTPAEIVEELSLAAFGRYPTASELAACVSRFDKPGSNRRVIVEDMMWALLNSPEFLFGD